MLTGTFMNQGHEFHIAHWLGQVMQQPAQYIPTNSNKVIYATCTRSLKTPLSFYNLLTKHDSEPKLISINFSFRGAEGSRSS